MPDNWRYRGLPAVQYWKSDVGTSPVLAVNARDTYWAIEQPIAGGLSIEHFELRLPFQDGQRHWFGMDVRQLTQAAGLGFTNGWAFGPKECKMCP